MTVTAFAKIIKPKNLINPIDFQDGSIGIPDRSRRAQAPLSAMQNKSLPGQRPGRLQYSELWTEAAPDKVRRGRARKTGQRPGC
jgi:hypothetical protein